MWIAAIIIAIFLAASVVGWHVFEFCWNRRLFVHKPGEHFTKNLRARDARQLLKMNSELTPVDVRPEKAFAKAHLPGAANAPFTGTDLDATSLDSTDRATPILVYCDGGYRSRKALPHLKELGFKSIYHLHRGILSWKLQKGSTDSLNSVSS